MSRINDSSYNNVKNIYVMSDIHGDLDLLIINLRDCAKVICDRDSSNWREYANNSIPNLNLEDIINSEIYDCLFNFEWCGNDKWIIILGDIIDNYRENYTLRDINNNDKRQNEIEHEELKIILFLNKLNKKAQQKGGNVIKLIGNHEDMNIYDNNNNIRYISKYAITNNFYTIKRKEIFRIHNNILNHIDYKYNSNKKYVIFKINDFIFVHGGLNQDIIKYFYSNITDKKDIDTSFYSYFKSFIKISNKYIKSENNNIDYFIDYINDEYNRCINNKTTCKYINDNSGLLWYRGLGSHDIIYDNNFCNELEKIFGRLCQNNEKCKQNIYIIIGHCIQSEFSLFNIKNNNSSHSKIKKYNNIHIIDGPIIETNIGKELYEKEINISNKTPMIFGITASCIKPNNPNLASIYRVDIGASRAFDNDNYNRFFKSYIEPIYDELYSNIYNIVKNNKYKFTSKYIKSSLPINKIYDKIIIITNIYKEENKIDILLISKLVEIILLNNKKFKNKIIRYIYQYFISRLPQILHIQYINELPNTEIIRSTLDNTIKHMIRNNIYIFNNKKFNNIIKKIINEIDNN